MTTNFEFFESTLSERNRRFNGVRAELQNEEIPAEIREIMKQKKSAK